jgi:hypothetical protein
MGLSPFYTGNGQTWPDQAFTTDSGIFPLTGLSNGAIALHMEDISNNDALYICTGAWVIRDGPNGPNGKADFTPSSADLTTGFLGKPGIYRIYPVVTLSSGPVAMDGQLIEVRSQP